MHSNANKVAVAAFTKPYFPLFIFLNQLIKKRIVYSGLQFVVFPKKSGFHTSYQVHVRWFEFSL